MMYLSKLLLNPHSRQVWAELANPYQMHRTILSAFPAELPKDERVLYRLEQQDGIISLLVQSQYVPDWGFLDEPDKDYLWRERVDPNPAVKQVDLRLQSGQDLRFRLLANPTVKKVRPGKKNNQRVALVQEDQQLDWLRRKFEAAGCTLLAASAAQMPAVRAKKEIHSLSFHAVRFDGVLKVKEPELLLAVVDAGIGSGKGLGFGLLSLAAG